VRFNTTYLSRDTMRDEHEHTHRNTSVELDRACNAARCVVDELGGGWVVVAAEGVGSRNAIIRYEHV
jgi:hypothetical protein